MVVLERARCGACRSMALTFSSNIPPAYTIMPGAVYGEIYSNTKEVLVLQVVFQDQIKILETMDRRH